MPVKSLYSRPKRDLQRDAIASTLPILVWRVCLSECGVFKKVPLPKYRQGCEAQVSPLAA